MKKIMAMVLSLALLLGMFANAPTASAASYSALSNITPNKYCKTYPLNTSGITIPYQDAGLTKRGTITFGRSDTAYIDNATDEIWILQADENGKWARVSFPCGSKRAEAYIALSAITSANASGTAKTSTGKFLCSPRYGSSTSSKYYVSKGETCYLISTKGNECQILYPCNTGWRLGVCSKSDYEKFCGSVTSEPIPEGVYTIVSYLDQNKVIDICGMSGDNYAQVQLWERNNCAAQDFQLIRHPDGWYLMINVYSWKALDVSNGVAARGQRVWQYEINYSAAQRWYLEDAGDGWFYIKSALGYYLDVSGACTSSGTPLQIWDGKNNAQKFRFEAKFSPVWPCEKSTYISTMYRYWNGGNPSSHKIRTNIYNAFDVSGNSGDKIFAVEKGTVVDKGYQGSGFGYYVILEHSNGLRTLYGHLKQAASVNVGDTVNQKQVIGYMGSSGNSSGNHLHFEMFNPNDKTAIINPWVTYYQGKVSVTIGGNSYKANSKYPSDGTATAWCNWLKNNCTKNSAGDYVFKK